MIFKSIAKRFDAIDEKLNAIVLLQRTILTTEPPEPEVLEKPTFKLDDEKMQDGISNIMGFDPFRKKRGDEE